MFENDFPLVSTACFMAVILQQAAEGAVTLPDCEERTRALFDKAGDRPGLPPAEISDRLAGHIRDLAIAGLLSGTGPGAWRLTERGRFAIREHPDGVDPSVLMQYPEYAAYIRSRAAGVSRADPRPKSYDEGYCARQDGRSFTANPYAQDTADHLSWENGWMQELEDSQRGI